jgi:hypothetical protein
MVPTGTLCTRVYDVPQYGRPGEPVVKTREKKENKNEFVRILSERYCAYVKDSRKNRESNGLVNERYFKDIWLNGELR